jgi:hypothetical protein
VQTAVQTCCGGQEFKKADGGRSLLSAAVFTLTAAARHVDRRAVLQRAVVFYFYKVAIVQGKSI